MSQIFTATFFIQLLKAYLFFAFLHAVFCIFRMYRIQHYACNKKKGKKRRYQLLQEGRVKILPLYTAEEITQNKKLGSVRLHVFENDTKERKKAIIICPGGGYDHLCTKTEGYPVAARLNELGYTACILEYRVGFDCSTHAPMQDLARAVIFIKEHPDFLNVDISDYAVIGFSAGGNLAGIFGTEEYGYKKYGVEKPGALILGYPWTNVNHWLKHPYWNIFIGLLGIWLSERGNLCMFGFGPHFLRKNRDSICVQNYVTDSYPATYMFAGGNDVLVISHSHTDVLEKALNEHNVIHKYEKFFGVPHGIGLGERTSAEGWLEEALDFWNNNISQ